MKKAIEMLSECQSKIYDEVDKLQEILNIVTSEKQKKYLTYKMDNLQSASLDIQEAINKIK